MVDSSALCGRGYPKVRATLTTFVVLLQFEPDPHLQKYFLQQPLEG